MTHLYQVCVEVSHMYIIKDLHVYYIYNISSSMCGSVTYYPYIIKDLHVYYIYIIWAFVSSMCWSVSYFPYIIKDRLAVAVTIFFFYQTNFLSGSTAIFLYSWDIILQELATWEIGWKVVNFDV